MVRTAPDGRISQTARGGILQDSGYNEAWDQARKTALTPARYGSPLGRRPYDLRHAAVSLWLNSGVPATEVARRAGHGDAVLLKIYATASTASPTPPTSASPTSSAFRTPSRSPGPATREMTTASRHPEMPGQRQEAGRTVGVTAPTGPVRGFFRPRPWTKPGAHGRMADGGGPGRSLEARMRWSAGGDSDGASGL